MSRGTFAGVIVLLTGQLATPAVRADGAVPGLRPVSSRPSRYVMQLDGPLTVGRRDALAQAGVQLDEYLSNNAYLVRLAPGSTWQTDAPRFVRSLREFPAAHTLEFEESESTYESFLRKWADDWES